MSDINDIKRRLKEAEAYAPDNPLLKDCYTLIEELETRMQAMEKAVEKLTSINFNLQEMWESGLAKIEFLEKEKHA